MTPPDPERGALHVAGRRLSSLDFGGPGRPLPALHGHFGEGRTFTRLAGELGDSWRVVALDQRGHGRSDRSADYSRSGYVEDAAVREYPDSCGVAFDPEDMNVSQQVLNGDHGDDAVPVEFAAAVRGFLDSL
ncbi:alpha/beta fold hydrolase [Streptomyces globisporus]|uniref:alpha/beta fold hydrolase n=1 Tax=Streptomyces globisporus TaxID=1908 RepID=UPI0036F50D12